MVCSGAPSGNVAAAAMLADGLVIATGPAAYYHIEGFPTPVRYARISSCHLFSGHVFWSTRSLAPLPTLPRVARETFRPC